MAEEKQNNQSPTEILDQVREKLSAKEYEALAGYFDAKCKEKLAKKLAEWESTLQKSLQQATDDQLSELKQTHLMLKAEPQAIDFFHRKCEELYKKEDNSINNPNDVAIHMISSLINAK